MKRSLAYRLRKAAHERDRYWNDEDRRLSVINATRRRKGQPPHASLADAQTQGRRL